MRRCFAHPAIVVDPTDRDSGLGFSGRIDKEYTENH